MTSLVRLIYLSRVAAPLGPADLTAIQQAARDRNPARGITGLLAFNADHFVQALEGSREAVCDLYQRIACDPRHRDCVIQSFGEVGARSFDDWSMGFIGLDDGTARILLRYTSDGTLSPQSLAPANAFDLLKALADELRSRRGATRRPGPPRRAGAMAPAA